MKVEVHTQSAFSFLRGASRPEDLVKQAVELGYRAIALADRNGFYGAPRLYQAAQQAGLHAIVGTTVDITIDGFRAPVALYAKDRTGYQNLCCLLTNAHTEIPKSIVRDHGIHLTLEQLSDYRSGVITLVLTSEGPLSQLRAHDQAAEAFVSKLTGTFSNGDCYLQYCNHLDRQQYRNNEYLEALALASKLPCAASNAVQYATPYERLVADIMRATFLRTTLDTAGVQLNRNGERYFKSPKVMQELFAHQPQALLNAERFADRCEFSLSNLGYRFPTPATDADESADDYLRRLTDQGAKERYGAITPVIRQQLDHELRLIKKLGFAGYFLIVWDIVQFCRQKGMLCQGRGSAANSAVCYSLKITAVDPIGMKLLFERFLSEERGEWPDIDIDLPSGEQRESVIQYVYQKYGPRGAAMTANVITFRSRGAIRTAGTALGFGRETLDRVAAHLGWSEGAPLQWSTDPKDLPSDPFAQRFIEAGLSVHDKNVQAWIFASKSLIGLPRHLGQHPGGMVIGAERLDRVTVLEPATMPGRTVLQWDKDDCESLGILKVDLLGLGMMAALERAQALVCTVDGVPFDLAKVPPEDPATYAMLTRADTIGVFQVESRAQMATLPRLAPKTFYDLVVEVAIIRPGPIVGKMVNPYLQRRMGREKITYPHPDLEPILQRTLGIPLFQEQLMRVVMTVGKFSGAQAEALRRAMTSRRSEAKMTALIADLRRGMTAHGVTLSAQEEIIRGVTSFSQYGFPESHAASFALIAYASAYLKCHFPASFFCALLDCWPMGFYHPATLVKQAQREGVQILPIDVTASNWLCDRHEGGKRGAIRLGLRYVHGLKQDTADRIVTARNAKAFVSMADFAHRSRASREELVTLADLGALASIPVNTDTSTDMSRYWTRRSAIWQIMAIAQQPPGGLFAGVAPATEPRYGTITDMTLSERITADYRNSGLTAGPHPMHLLRQRLQTRGIHPCRDCQTIPNARRVSIAGVVITRQRPQTAKGFFFITLEDETGMANAIVTPQLFAAQRPVLVTENALILHGIIQRQDGVTHLRVASAEPLSITEGLELPDGHNFH